MGKDTYYAIGGMSGTSLDGVDLAYCHYFKKDKRWNFKLIEAETIPYPAALKLKLEKITKNYNNNYNDLDIELGKHYSNLINNFIANKQIGQLDFIANHGQTIYHNPAKKITIQIGDGKTIANVTSHLTINNFRLNDVSLGGQGAPLVPIGDWHFFNDYTCCINLGGISNITIQNQQSVLMAFDISPCNVLLNYYANKLNFPFDKDGALAQSGNVHKALFEQLNEHDYYKKAAPKSLDAQFCVKEFAPLINTFEIEVVDILCTLCHHYAFQINAVIESKKNTGKQKVLLSGGGALNKYLTKTIQEKVMAEVHIPEKTIIEYKEAIIFGFLGLLKLENEVNCLKVVTGAENDNIGGVIHKP